MKKFLSVCLATVLVLSMNPVAFALNNATKERVDAIELNVESFLSSVSVNCGVNDSIKLYNFGNELEALFYPLNEGGYVVASYKDGHIIEFSPNSMPVSRITDLPNQNIYYGGPLSFCVRTDDDSFTDVVTGAEIKDTTDYYSVDSISTIYPQSFIQYRTQADSLLSPPINYISTNPWFCCLTGIHNLLQYYNDYYAADVYMTNSFNDPTHIASLLSFYQYIYNGPLKLSSAASAHYDGSGEHIYTGLRSYFNRNDVDHYNVQVSSATYKNVKKQIGLSRPVLIHINTSSLIPGNTSTHIVLCYGYWETSMTTYYIVNDGYGSNSVYVCADDIPSTYEMMYLYE